MGPMQRGCDTRKRASRQRTLYVCFKGAASAEIRCFGFGIGLKFVVRQLYFTTSERTWFSGASSHFIAHGQVSASLMNTIERKG
jgi:hypothetical protein